MMNDETIRLVKSTLSSRFRKDTLGFFSEELQRLARENNLDWCGIGDLALGMWNMADDFEPYPEDMNGIGGIECDSECDNRIQGMIAGAWGAAFAHIAKRLGCNAEGFSILFDEGTPPAVETLSELRQACDDAERNMQLELDKIRAKP